MARAAIPGNVALRASVARGNPRSSDRSADTTASTRTQRPRVVLRKAAECTFPLLRAAGRNLRGTPFGSGSNAAQTRVGHKEIRNRALRDHNPDAVIGLELTTELIECPRQNFIEKIYRPVIFCDRNIAWEWRHIGDRSGRSKTIGVSRTG
jgi:hypothetical protein